MIEWAAIGGGAAAIAGIAWKLGGKQVAARLVGELAAGARKKVPPKVWEAAQGILEAHAAAKAKADREAFEAQMAELRAKAEHFEKLAKGLTLPPPLAELAEKREAAIVKGKAAARPRRKK